MSAPRDMEIVWIKLRAGEGFWYLGQRENGKWYVFGAKANPHFAVAEWRPFR